MSKKELFKTANDLLFENFNKKHNYLYGKCEKCSRVFSKGGLIVERALCSHCWVSIQLEAIYKGIKDPSSEEINHLFRIWQKGKREN